MAQARPRQASRKRPASRPAVPRALWGMVGGVIVLFVVLLVWLGGQKPQPEQLTRGVPHETPKTTGKPASPQQDARAVATPPAKELAPPPPRYEFYNMLPAQTVDLPPPVREAPATSAASVDAPPKAEQPMIEPQVAKSTRFELQVGSFRRYEEADRRKAELALLGFSASIQSANVNGENWHRVKVGPLPEADARKALDRLKAVGMNPLMVKKGG
ncbi:MAG: SPOR domain-containing protein [Pseudomonadota bacterium]